MEKKITTPTSGNTLSQLNTQPIGQVNIQPENTSQLPRGNNTGNTQGNFIYYSQRDPLWGGEAGLCPYDKEGNYLSSGGTNYSFSQIGCGITVDAMLLSNYSSKKMTPIEVKDTWFTAPGYNCGSYYGPHADVLNQNGFSVTAVENPSKAYIAENASYDNPIVVGVKFSQSNGEPATHYTLAVGTNASGEIIYQDPFFGSNIPFPREYEVLDAFTVVPPDTNQ